MSLTSSGEISAYAQGKTMQDMLFGLIIGGFVSAINLLAFFRFPEGSPSLFCCFVSLIPIGIVAYNNNIPELIVA